MLNFIRRCGAAFLAAVLWTIFTTKEYPPENLETFRRKKAESKGLGHFAGEIFSALREMPRTMKQLALVQFFTWLGLFCMWLHFSNAVPVVFGSSDPTTDPFKRGAEWAGVCYAVKDGVTFVAAFALMALSRERMARRRIHGVCLALGGLGLLAVGFIHGEGQKNFLLLALALGGVAWASILSMPYAILAGALPAARMGLYMGIFNFSHRAAGDHRRVDIWSACEKLSRRQSGPRDGRRSVHAHRRGAGAIRGRTLHDDVTT